MRYTTVHLYINMKKTTLNSCLFFLDLNEETAQYFQFLFSIKEEKVL